MADDRDRQPCGSRRSGGPSSWGRRVIFTTAILFVVLAGAEVGLRLLDIPPRPEPRVPKEDPTTVFHSFLQNVERVEIDGRLVRAFRGQVYDQERTTAVRVICLGGSTTWGHGVAPGESWPAVLEGELRSRGYDAEVINAGEPWYTTAHSLINYVLQMRAYNADVVVIMHGINDLMRSFPLPDELPFERDYGSYQGPMHNALSGLQEHPAAADSPCLDPAALLRSTSLYRLVFARPHAGSKAPEIEAGLEMYCSLPSYRENLEYLTDLCLDDGRAVVLCTQAHLFDSPDVENFNVYRTVRRQFFCPSAGQPVSNHSLAVAMEAARQATFDIGARMNVPVADVRRAVGGDGKYFVDDVHLSADGNAIIAQTMADVLGPILDGRRPRASSHPRRRGRATRSHS